MLSEFLQDRAALYVSGALSPAERESFEVIAEFDPELRSHLSELSEISAATTALQSSALAAPPAGLRARVLAEATNREQLPKESLVVTGADGRVVWVNDEFTAMCGHSLAEIRGQKPGHLLQGPGTDTQAVERIRASLRERRPCHEQLVNYHKSGAAYRADIRISPFCDDAGEPLYFVARERKLADASVPAAR
jgi:PAS domain S-box-containing protein